MNHIGDDDFDSPLVINNAAPAPAFSQEAIVMVTSMGFTENQAKKALSSTFLLKILIFDY